MAMTFEELDKQQGIHERRLETMEKRQDKQDDALAEMNAHIGDVDRRQAKLEGIIEEISGTLVEIEEGQRELRNGQWRLVLLIFGAWVTLAGLILFKLS